MSIFSDYQHGYMDDFEFEQECARMNREDRYEREHLYAGGPIDIEYDTWDEEYEEDIDES